MKKKILSIDDPSFETCKKRAIIKRDDEPPDPLHDWDQTFLLHSRIPREFSGNERDKSYEKPVEEILDEDGFGTGEYRLRNDVVAFDVAAYIHSGVWLSLGSGSEFPDQRWDVTRQAAVMWTDKKRFEKMNGPWMEIWDEKAQARRPAKDMDEFREYLRGIAKAELDTLMKCRHGEAYGYVTEEAVRYKKTYEDGRVEEGVDWESGLDSCWGYVVEKGADIDFPKGEDWAVFDETGDFVGEEYEAA